MEIFSGGTIHEGSSPYLWPQSPWVLGNPSWILSQTEKESESQKKSQNASVGRPAARPTHASVDRAVDQTQTESSLLSVGRPFHATVDRAVDRANPMHNVHTGRPAFSTGRPGANLACFNASSCSFVFRSLYLLPSPLSPLSLQFPHKLMMNETRRIWMNVDDEKEISDG